MKLMMATTTTTRPMRVNIERMMGFLFIVRGVNARPCGLVPCPALDPHSFNNSPNASTVSATPPNTKTAGTGWPKAISHKITHDGVRYV